MESTAQGISHGTFLLLSPHVHWAAVSQEMHRGEMRHMPLFKGYFDYIRVFFPPFFPFAANLNPVFICLSVSIEMHLLQFGKVPLREAMELGCGSLPHTNLQF